MKKTPCIIGKGVARTDGYKRCGYLGKVDLSHRIEWLKRRGPIPKGKSVGHTCGVPACINIDHLELIDKGQMRRPMSLKELVMRHLTIGKPKECWNWQAGKSKLGYGRIGVRGRVAFAHRAAYEVLVGPIPNGMLCCHKCDNPSCCNPNHLFIGTHKDNSQDMVRKGRASGGPNSTKVRQSRG